MNEIEAFCEKLSRVLNFINQFDENFIFNKIKELEEKISDFNSKSNDIYNMTNHYKDDLNKHYYTLQSAFNDFVKEKNIKKDIVQEIDKIKKQISDLNDKITNLFFQNN